MTASSSRARSFSGLNPVLDCVAWGVITASKLRGWATGRLGEYCGVAPTSIVQADVALNMLALPDRESALGRAVVDARMLPFKEGASPSLQLFSFFSQVAEDAIDAAILPLLRAGASAN
jgi:hypothetical protein